MRLRRLLPLCCVGCCFSASRFPPPLAPVAIPAGHASAARRPTSIELADEVLAASTDVELPQLPTKLQEKVEAYWEAMERGTGRDYTMALRSSNKAPRAAALLCALLAAATDIPRLPPRPQPPRQLTLRSRPWRCSGARVPRVLGGHVQYLLERRALRLPRTGVRGGTDQFGAAPAPNGAGAQRDGTRHGRRLGDGGK